MINNGLGDHQRVGRIGEEAADYTLHGVQLGGEFGCSFGVSVKPFLDELDLIAEVVGGSAEGWGVEGGFFETNRPRIRDIVLASMVRSRGYFETYTTLTSFPTGGNGVVAWVDI